MKFDNEGFLNVKEIEGIPVIIDKVPTNTKEYQSTTLTEKKYIVIHNAGNPNADDTVNNNFMKNDDYVLWHFTVDEDSITQGHSILRSAFHAGDGGKGKGNLNGIGIEIADNADVSKACYVAFKLIKVLQKDSPYNELELAPHQAFSGKYCPRWILDNWGWKGFVLRYEEYLKASSVPEWKRKIVMNAFDLGNINDLEKWMDDIDQSIPVWAVLAMINNSREELLKKIEEITGGKYGL